MKVFVDMDGVLADFVGDINKCMGIPKNTIPAKWDWWTDYGFIFKQVNSFCTIKFWQNLSFTPDGARILDAVLAKFDVNDVYLLTAPMPNPGSWTGKRLWVQDNLPTFAKRLIATQAPKSMFASPIIGTTLLIDDKDENVEEFVKAGGYGILVPRPWNKLRELADNSLQVVKNGLEAY